MTNNVNTVEDAYALIANILQVSAANAQWKSLTIEAPILGSNLGGTATSQTLVDGREVDIQVGWKIFDIQEAALYLREQILRATGDRIWGLTFTLYPDGKFNIEYDYNKPEGYEETDETISGDEINQSLARLAGNGDASS